MKILLFVLARNMSGFAQCPFLTMHSYLQGTCGCLVWCVHQLPSLRDNLSGSSAGTTLVSKSCTVKFLSVVCLDAG